MKIRQLLKAGWSWILKSFRKPKGDLRRLYDVPHKSSLGQGGNGIVREVTRKADGQAFVLKMLSTDASRSKEKRLRFQDEIQTLNACQGYDGVMPIVDFSIEELWYTMPKAENIDKYTTSIDAKVDCIISIADTLCKLHNAGFAHRDIKPDNILYLDGHFVLCDFGLVDIPNNPHNLTKNSNRIGPMSTIAPEMKRHAKSADGKKADVYSLAKTLWILLTGTKKGFDGVYDCNDSTIALSNFPSLRSNHLVEIEELLNISTQHDPDKRPTMLRFKEILELWKQIKGDEFKVSQSNWHFLMRRLFQTNVPAESTWYAVPDIIDVLNKVTSLPIPCYIFFPDGGELKLEAVGECGELELKAGSECGEADCVDAYSEPVIYRVKPKRLLFNSFDVSAWDYFLLELEELEDVVGDCVDEYEEVVVEDHPQHFVSAKDATYGVYDYDTGEKLPKDAKIIHRYLKGSLLIVLKLGPYNYIPESTDGRHANCSADEFRKYIAALKMLYQAKSFLSKDEWTKARNNIIGQCPFKPCRNKPFQSGSISVQDEDFVDNNFKNFDFSDCIPSTSNSATNAIVEYTFIFVIEKIVSVFRSKDEDIYMLCNDGKIREKNTCTNNILHVYNLQDAQRVYTAINGKLHKLCEGKVQTYKYPYFRPIIYRIGTPKHLFTLEEIERLMRSADDRVDNVLVIAPDGNAHIIQDRTLSCLYPVVHETWCAGNIYVGKYSSLGDLRAAYHYCLAKWYDYMKECHGQPMEDYDACTLSTEELIRIIKDHLS